MSKKSLILYSFFSLLCLNALHVSGQTYGLKFQGQAVTLDKRTELNLTPEEFLKFGDEFEVSFDIKIDFIEPNYLFGYILRVINKENFNVDLISTPDPAAPLNLVIGKNNTVIPIRQFSNSGNQWVNLRLKFMLSANRVVFYLADSFYVHNDIGFKEQDEFKIIFGANDHKQFKTTDVPSMNIKDVKISEKGKLKYHWILDEREGITVYDRIRRNEALVVNPVWLACQHDSWKQAYETELKGQILFASDEKNGRIFLINNDELQIFSAQDEEVNVLKYTNKPKFITSSFNAVYNSRDGKIYCYVPDEPVIFSLDTQTGTWDDTTSTYDLVTKYRHHNRYYNPDDNSIYILGGYGVHTYNNIIRKIDIGTETLHDLPTNDSVFYPRYLAGLGAINDTLYILGGYGSLSGNQLINPHSYYDLIGFSLKDSTLFKKFEISRIMDDMSVANSMWINPNTRNFYALVFQKTQFNGNLQLVRGSIDSPQIEMLGNKIPFKFLDIRSYSGLLYMPNQNKLFAITSYDTDSLTAKASIFSISYPPNKLIVTSEPKTSEEKAGYLYSIAAILLTAVFAWFIIIRTKGKRSVVPVQMTDGADGNLLAPDSLPIDTENEIPGYRFVLFGGFQVFNKNNEDITSKFSPLLKELFLLIILHTYKYNKGISSEKITEILWFDKSVKSARNNRAVNIAKLKAILNEVGDCELTKKTGYWKLVSLDHKIFCDYQDFLNITSSKNNITKQKISLLLNITKKGAFLHNVQYEWLDKFKGEISDIIIDTLINYAESLELGKDSDLIIQVCDCIFNFDMLNEEAMILKCRAEHVNGNHSLAKLNYENFCKEYQNMYSQEYSLSFLKILNIQ